MSKIGKSAGFSLVEMTVMVMVVLGLAAVVTPKLVRGHNHRGRYQCSRHQPIANDRIEVARPLLQPVQMQRSPFGCRNDVSRGPGPVRFRNAYLTVDRKSFGNPFERFNGFRRGAAAEVVGRNGDT